MKKIIFLTVLILTIIACNNNSKSEKNKDEGKISSKEDKIISESSNDNKLSYQKTFNLREKYLGLKYEYPTSTDFISEHGSPETLEGTNNEKWIVYFPKGDLTVLIKKKTNTVVNICSGKYPDIINEVTVDFLNLINKRIEYNEYTSKISSIRYGKPEKLGMTNCVNKDCVEYYPKGDFTTVTFNEFTDEGDFVTLKKIGMGKTPNLINYE